MLSLVIMAEHANEVGAVFIGNFSLYRLMMPPIMLGIEFLVNMHLLKLVWGKFSPARADDVRTELLKLQITSL